MLGKMAVASLYEDAKEEAKWVGVAYNAACSTIGNLACGALPNPAAQANCRAGVSANCSYVAKNAEQAWTQFRGDPFRAHRQKEDKPYSFDISTGQILEGRFQWNKYAGRLEVVPLVPYMR